MWLLARSIVGPRTQMFSSPWGNLLNVNEMALLASDNDLQPARLLFTTTASGTMTQTLSAKWLNAAKYPANILAVDVLLITACGTHVASLPAQVFGVFCLLPVYRCACVTRVFIWPLLLLRHFLSSRSCHCSYCCFIGGHQLWCKTATPDWTLLLMGWQRIPPNRPWI